MTYIPDAGGSYNDLQCVGMNSDMEAIIAAIAGDGVLSGCGVTAQGSPNMTVAIAAGVVKIGGQYITVSAGNGTITTAHATLNRLDIVTVDNTGTKTVTAGTPAASPGAPAIPANSVLLAQVFVPAATSTITATRITRTGLRIARPKMWVNAKDAAFGATGDGSTDDTAALQAAETAARAVLGCGLYIPAGQYRLTSTLTIGSSVSGTDSYTYIKGDGPQATILRWDGSTSGTAIRLKRAKYAHYEGFGLINDAGGSPSSTKGIVQDGNTATYGGTQTLAHTWEDIYIQGFHHGIEAGGDEAASSEINYTSLELVSCDVGWIAMDLNTLNHKFSMLKMSGCGIGLQAGATQNFNVYGGSASNSTMADFFIDSANGSFSINGFRSETAELFLTTGSGKPHVAVRDCIVTNPQASDLASVNGTYGKLTIQNSEIAGKVRLTNCPHLTMESNQVFGELTGAWSELPFGPDTSVADYTASTLRWHCRNNTFRDDVSGSPPVSPFTYPDSTGHAVIVNNDGTVFAPSGFRTVPMFTTKTLIGGNGDNAAQTGDPERLALMRVASLSGGSELVGKNFHAQAVMSGSGKTMAFTFKRTLTVKRDTTPPSSFTNCIEIVPTLPGDRFFPTDVGKPITLGLANLWVRYYIDSTHVALAPYSAALEASSANLQATLGEDEPNANYTVQLSHGGAEGEQIRWQTKTAQGFTLASDVNGSTAEVDILITRAS